jgi:hypothetical protein
LIQIETGVGLGFVKLIKQARETAREFELADDYDAAKDVKVVSAAKFCTMPRACPVECHVRCYQRDAPLTT